MQAQKDGQKTITPFAFYRQDEVSNRNRLNLG